MKKIISSVSTILFCLIIVFDLSGQVLISPQVGMSYKPFTYGTNLRSSRIDFILGFEGVVLLSDDYFFSSSMSFVNREDVKWLRYGAAPEPDNNELIHQDLNFDFTIYKKMSDLFKAGVGLSFTKKINTKTIRYNSLFTEVFPNTGLIFGPNANVRFTLMDASLTLRYVRDVKYINPDDRFTLAEKNRFDLILSVPIFK